MAKGPHLTDRIKELLAQIYVTDRQTRPAKARELLLKAMKAEDLDEFFGADYPAISTVSKELKSLRERDTARPPESKRLDQPWSLGCLANRDYHIPAEALRLVMIACEKRLSEDDVLTIREALWIGRLYGVLECTDLVYDWAFLYALWEMVYEAQGKAFNSKELDLEMMRTPEAARETQREIAIWKIAEKYGADPVGLKDLNLSVEATEDAAKPGKYKKEGTVKSKSKSKQGGTP